MTWSFWCKKKSTKVYFEQNIHILGPIKCNKTSLYLIFLLFQDLYIDMSLSSFKVQCILSHFFFAFNVLLLVLDLVSVDDDSFFLSLASSAAALLSLFVRCWVLRWDLEVPGLPPLSSTVSIVCFPLTLFSVSSRFQIKML